MATKFDPNLKVYNKKLNRQGNDSPSVLKQNSSIVYSENQHHLKPASPQPVAKAMVPNHSSLTLRQQLLMMVLPTVLVPLAIASTVGYKTVQQDAENRIRVQLQDQSLLTSQVASKILEDAMQLPAMMANNPLVIDAARAGSQQAETEKLDQLPVAQVEKRFTTTKLLKTNQSLNDYLSKVAKTAGLAELFLTDRHGFNIAFSNPTSDFVQSDEQWWQKGKSASQWIGEPQFDQSANSFSVDLVQAIKAPGSGEFLGIVKAVLPSSKFTLGGDYLEHTGIRGSQQLQILDASTGGVINSVTAQGASITREVVGGEAIVQMARSLVKAFQDQEPNPEQVMSEVKTKYSLQKLTITPFAHETGKQVLVASFIHEGRQYTLATSPQTDWVAAASMDTGEIAGAGNKLVLVFALTFLILGGVAIAIVLHLARQLSTPLSNLSDTAKEVASGNLYVTAEPRGTAETQTLAQTFNNLVKRLRLLLSDQASEIEKTGLFGDIAVSPARTERDLDDVFEKAVHGALRILEADRVVIYRFHPDWRGYICAEAVVPGLPRASGNKIEDACIGEHLLEAYRQGRVVPTNNVFEAGFHPDHLRLMERLEIKANLVTPILKDGQLFGLMIAHHCSAPHSWQQSEINFLKELAIRVGFTLDRVNFLIQKEAETERAGQLNAITARIRDAAQVEEIYQAAITGIRETLKTDRAVVYLFDENWQGSIVAEAVGREWPVSLGANIDDPCFADQYIQKYKQGRVKAVDNIYEAGLTPCYLRQLEPFKVKANLVAPLLAYNKLHGLLVTHQCSSPRPWQEAEITFFKQVATQVGLALDRVDFLGQIEQARQQAEMLAEEQRQQKETLQQQLLELLSDVEGAASGDLTVRAEVSVGEIGTVADFFNAVIESLRSIVTNVKTAVTQVNASLGENEQAIQQLSNEALKQAEDTTRTLDSVEQMTHSIQEVADNARQAAVVARMASSTAETGGLAMDRTVENIFTLRETVADATKKVKRLGESSQRISRVASLIKQIALQTNVLAINAGMEAARAGEEGQGFAVVAEEVGELAARSTDATQEIEKMVASIQQETAEVVAAMEVGTHQVVEGSNLVEEAKLSLTQILEVSRQIDALVQSISTATVSQAETSQAVTELMKEIALVSERTSNSTRQVSGSLQETVGIAAQLQASVGTFNVGSEI
jgi:methyl-accepting chemotaxis protein